MEQFYRVLRRYNLQRNRTESEPEWTRIYEADRPPPYWTKVGEALCDWPRRHLCIEIGSGVGDILALLLHLGFQNVLGLERDANLAKAAKSKLEALFGRPDVVLTAEYPIRLASRPNVLLQVNCMYTDGMADKGLLLERLRSWHCFNGVPDLYLLEVVDASFEETHAAFPLHIRFAENEIAEAFRGFRIEACETYSYPRNSTTKRLYAIALHDPDGATLANTSRTIPGSDLPDTSDGW